MKIFKETIWSKINKNLYLFIFMLFWIVIILNLLGKFYHWDRFWILYIPFAYTIDWIFSNTWMFVSSIIYVFIWIWIIIYLFKEKFIDNNKKRPTKCYYRMITLVTLWVYAMFYITNPWYTLQTHPRLFLYQNWENITNKEIYFFLTERYWFDATLYKPFETLEDSIEGLEFAMEKNESGLYNSIFYDLEKFWYDKVLEKYKNKTFQAFYLRRMTNINTNYEEQKNFFLNNLKLLDYLEKNALDEIIVDVSKYTKKQFMEFNNLELSEKDFYYDINKYWDKIYDINWIHLNMFIQSEILKYKKTLNWDWEVIK